MGVYNGDYEVTAAMETDSGYCDEKITHEIVSDTWALLENDLIESIRSIISAIKVSGECSGLLVKKVETGRSYGWQVATQLNYRYQTNSAATSSQTSSYLIL